ncbi:MAG: zeta toxin family protein [Gemmatimonadota bacterium]|nr:zeta toxin family protein [Gemmatimonadota bacterium]
MNADWKIIIIAGPNGAGKTTFALEYLPHEAQCPPFVNADLIAAGLSPFQPETALFRAGRLMLEEIKNHVQQRRSFAFETTLSGLSYARMIPRWRSDGYTVKLIFLALATPEEAIKRVELRVKHGGHHVPPDVIRRRFASGLQNFQNKYCHIVDYWQWFDNSGTTPILVDEGENP